ncbi:hypothetical protein BDA96_03G069800 [Sorghum bicolor]|uniref:DUF674 domain-containing protein n=2 Tax=Sorghum bicolor TaxID=4558 RepID=A0A921RB61_SORBI|nr:hypothetical protein BDA96_03G069800 [Sorghum bicolor]KXG31841.1 hypothetical protein SORBI_3003G066200 [Sorghum bicolor]
MATTTMILKMKLLIDTKKNRVLFAEANKDVVDFLFSLLALPVATIVKMLGKESMCGSVGNLYGSVENLDYSYVPRPKNFFKCSYTHCNDYVTDSSGVSCPSCGYKNRHIYTDVR